MSQQNQSQKMKAKNLFKEWRPEWNDAISDLSIHKASPQELERKKLICKSKNAEIAKLELKSKKIYSKPEKLNESLQKKKSLIKELLFESSELLKTFDSPNIAKQKRQNMTSKYRSDPLVTPAPDFKNQWSLVQEKELTKNSTRFNRDHSQSPKSVDQLKSPRSEQILKMPTDSLQEMKEETENSVEKQEIFNQLLSNISKALTEMEKKLSSGKSSSHELLDEFRKTVPYADSTEFTEKLLCVLYRLLHFIQKIKCETERERHLREELKMQIRDQGSLINELTLELIHMRKENIRSENSGPIRNRDLEANYSSSGDENLLKSSSGNILNDWMKTLSSCPSHAISTGKLNKSLSLPDFRLISAVCENCYFKNKILTSSMMCNASKETLTTMDGIKTSGKGFNTDRQQSKEMNLDKTWKPSECNNPILSSRSINQLVYSEGLNSCPKYISPSISAGECMLSSAERVSIAPWLKIPFKPAIMLTVPQQCDISGIAPIVETNMLWFESSCMIKELKKMSPKIDKISKRCSLPRLKSITEDIEASSIEQYDRVNHIEKSISDSASYSVKKSSSSLNENLELSESSDSHKLYRTHCSTGGSGKPNRTTPASDVIGNGSNPSDTMLSDAFKPIGNNQQFNKDDKQLDINALLSKLEALQNQYFNAQLQLKSLMTTTNSYQNGGTEDQFLSGQKLSVL